MSSVEDSIKNLFPDVFPTGSRFFGNARNNSDWDFIAPKSIDTYDKIQRLGGTNIFYPSSTYIDSRIFLSIWEFIIDNEPIHLLVIKPHYLEHIKKVHTYIKQNRPDFPFLSKAKRKQEIARLISIQPPPPQPSLEYQETTIKAWKVFKMDEKQHELFPIAFLGSPPTPVGVWTDALCWCNWCKGQRDTLAAKHMLEPESNCGFYSLFTLDYCKSVYEQFYPDFVIRQVEVGGIVLEFEYGYRSSRLFVYPED